MASLDRAADGQMAGEVGMGGHGFSDGGNVLLRSAGSAGCTTKRYEPAHKITRRHVAPAPRDPESIGVPTRVLPVPPRKVHIKDVIEYKKRNLRLIVEPCSPCHARQAAPA